MRSASQLLSFSACQCDLHTAILLIASQWQEESPYTHRLSRVANIGHDQFGNALLNELMKEHDPADSEELVLPQPEPHTKHEIAVPAMPDGDDGETAEQDEVHCAFPSL